MRKLLYIAFALAAGSSLISGQTNLLAYRCQLYSIPPLQLCSEGGQTASSHATLIPAETLSVAPLKLELAPTPSEPDTPNLRSAERLTASFETTAASREREFDLQVFHRLDQAGYFDRPRAGSDSPVVRWAEKTFEPSVFHIGKTDVTCSVLTAIEHKNPLCLLNPYFLTVSW